MEWITKGTEHGGARALKKGETCADCHSEEAGDMGKKIVGGAKLEPSPIAGKAPFINARVQAAHDGQNLYLRFSWQQPAASGAAKMDAKNPVKLAYMLEAGAQVELAEQGGCWGSCHNGVRTMPGGDEQKTKYVKDGSLAAGVYYDLNQWRSGENKAYDGHIAEARVMEGGSALKGATGGQNGGTWSVVFTRAFAGGQGDVTLEPGKVYNFASPSTTTTPAVATTTSRWATSWASTPRRGSPPSVCKNLSPSLQRRGVLFPRPTGTRPRFFSLPLYPGFPPLRGCDRA